MPKETKETNAKETKKKVASKTAKKSTTKKATTSKATTKKTTVAKKSTATTTKKTTKAKSTTTKKATKTTSTGAKKTKVKKTSETTTFVNEYYDLPYRYNQTIVKILAQTPKILFVYWDISDFDRENFKKTYGENFFETTKPILVIHNITMNYSFEIEINDFANSWYVHINDADCEYNIELGRRPIPFADNQENVPEYIYISSSNDLETPNDRVLYNPPLYKEIYFRNVKTNEIIVKSIFDFPFIGNVKNIGEFYNVYDLYKKLYEDENLNFINNPSSGATSSMFSSQFK